MWISLFLACGCLALANAFDRSHRTTYQNHYYVIYKFWTISWTDSRLRCKDDGGYLAVPSTVDEFEILATLAKESESDPWFGVEWRPICTGGFNNCYFQPSWVSEAGSVSDDQPWFVEDTDTARSKLWDATITFNRTRNIGTGFHIIRDVEPGDNELIREDRKDVRHGFVCEIEQRCGENGLAGVCDVNYQCNRNTLQCEARACTRNMCNAPSFCLSCQDIVHRQKALSKLLL